MTLTLLRRLLTAATGPLPAARDIYSDVVLLPAPPKPPASVRGDDDAKTLVAAGAASEPPPAGGKPPRRVRPPAAADPHEPGLTFDEWWARRQSQRGPLWPLTAADERARREGRHVCGTCSCCRTLADGLMTENDSLRSEVARLLAELHPGSGVQWKAEK